MDKLVRKGRSPATALASRENGRKSRGPVTDQGKAMCRANAGKHWPAGADLSSVRSVP